MPNSVKKLEILRISLYGHWDELIIRCVISDESEFISSSQNTDDRNEENATTSLLDSFVRLYSYRYLRNINLDQMRSDVLQGFQQLRENDSNDYSQDSMEISLVSEEPLEPHFSCKENESQSSGNNEILQSEVQQKLATVAKDSKVMKFFEDNKCSVCLRSYKEILDNNLHIVVPSCGHPLCCECAYNILMGEKKECPRCRGNITAKSFSLMKFNAELDVENQRVFL